MKCDTCANDTDEDIDFSDIKSHPCLSCEHNYGSNYTKKPKEWFEKIPKDGVWCYVWGGAYSKGDYIEKVISYSKKFKTFSTYDSEWENAEPVPELEDK